MTMQEGIQRRQATDEIISPAQCRMRPIAAPCLTPAPPSELKTRRPRFRGRPSKFYAVWSREKAEELLQLFCQGASVDEAAACLEITRPTLYAWLTAPDKQEFREVMEIGVQLAKAWWDRQGRDGLTRRFNTCLWEVNMRNRYGWMSRGEAEEALPHRARELSEVESVRDTVDVAAIIRAVEAEDGQSLRETGHRSTARAAHPTSP